MGEGGGVKKITAFRVLYPHFQYVRNKKKRIVRDWMGARASRKTAQEQSKLRRKTGKSIERAGNGRVAR